MSATDLLGIVDTRITRTVRDFLQRKSLPILNESAVVLFSKAIGTYQTAKAIVTAGLKWPPDVGPAMMIANMIPRAKARPIWKKLLNAVTGGSVEAPWTMKEATEAKPGKLCVRVPLALWIAAVDDTHEGVRLHVNEDTCRLANTFTQPSWSSTLKV